MKASQIEHLAYWLWQHRGMPDGSPEADWFLAEALLKRNFRQFEILMGAIPWYCVNMGKRTR